jgi:hypothetical protein
VGAAGRELRCPFLDEPLVAFLSQEAAAPSPRPPPPLPPLLLLPPPRRCPLAFLCDLNLPPGAGDKRLLRAAAVQIGFQVNRARAGLEREVRGSHLQKSTKNSTWLCLLFLRSF